MDKPLVHEPGCKKGGHRDGFVGMQTSPRETCRRAIATLFEFRMKAVER